MRNFSAFSYKSNSPFIQVKFGLKCLAAIAIAFCVAVGINSWQESTDNYWREFNTVRVAHLRSQKGIAVGELAPEFELISRNGKQTVTLYSLGEKPVVLIFGSLS